MVSLKDVKQYLRVDYDDDDKLIESILTAAKKLCLDVLMTSDIAVLNNSALYVRTPGRSGLSRFGAYASGIVRW